MFSGLHYPILYSQCVLPGVIFIIPEAWAKIIILLYFVVLAYSINNSCLHDGQHTYSGRSVRTVRVLFPTLSRDYSRNG